jgi:hypothetical protein
MSIVFATLGVIIFSIKDANAYLDPGTGSFIFQMIAGLFLGGVFYFRTFLKTINQKIFKKKITSDNSDTSTEKAHVND